MWRRVGNEQFILAQEPQSRQRGFDRVGDDLFCLRLGGDLSHDIRARAAIRLDLDAGILRFEAFGQFLV